MPSVPQTSFVSVIRKDDPAKMKRKILKLKEEVQHEERAGFHIFIKILNALHPDYMIIICLIN